LTAHYLQIRELNSKSLSEIITANWLLRCSLYYLQEPQQFPKEFIFSDPCIKITVSEYGKLGGADT